MKSACFQRKPQTNRPGFVVLLMLLIIVVVLDMSTEERRGYSTRSKTAIQKGDRGKQLLASCPQQ
jgi:hypothetical protein